MEKMKVYGADICIDCRNYKAIREKRGFAEVKGVTLEEDGVARFPDAPTERGIKHLRGLVRAMEEGYEAYVIFVIQMSGMKQNSHECGFLSIAGACA